MKGLFSKREYDKEEIKIPYVISANSPVSDFNKLLEDGIDPKIGINFNLNYKMYINIY